MDYLLRGDTESLNKLSGIFTKSCHAQGLEVGMVRATLIMIKLIDDAKKCGIIKEVQERATFVDGYGLVEAYLKRHSIPHVQAELMAFDIVSILAKRKKGQEGSDES